MLDAAHNHGISSETAPDLRCYCISTPRAGWIVACTHPQAERWADTNLRRRGYRTYLPLVTVRRRDRALPSLSRQITIPLFSGYLFVWFDNRDSWRPIYETPGVGSVIKCGSEIQWAPEAAVSALQALETERATPSPPHSLWAPGVPCSLATGPFQGHQAVVTQVAHDMATVAVLMFGALREVAVQLDALTPRTE